MMAMMNAKKNKSGEHRINDNRNDETIKGIHAANQLAIFINELSYASVIFCISIVVDC